jgi:pilus assembly protein CpaE
VAISVTLIGERDRELEDRLRGAGMRPTTIPSSELSTLIHPSSPIPDIVVLDLRAEPQIPHSLPLLKRQHPETAVVIIASTLDPALMLDAMRAGVTECVTDIHRGDLEAAIVRLMAQRAGPDIGEVFVFVGAKGGVGTTTAAVNVASALSKAGSTLLIDLHFAGGDAALYLGAEPRFSVIDALENTHRLDAAYFRSLVVRTKAGPDILASADRALTGPVDPLRVKTLVDFAGRHYRYTLLDIPRSEAAVLDSLEDCSTIAVVTNQELPTVRGTARLVSTLRRRYGKDKVEVILSRSDRRAELSIEDLEKAINGTIKSIFPSDYRLAVDALNRGRPLVMDGNTPLAAAYQSYARELAGLTDDRADRGIGLFGRLTGRR